MVLMMVACAAIAVDNPKVSLDAKETPIAQVLADLSKQAGVQIACDTDLKQTVTGKFGSLELEKVLDVITKSNDLTWQKLYLPTKADEKLTVAQIKARAEAVAAMTSGSVIVCDHATGKQRVFVEQEASAPSVSPDKLGLTAVYLVSKPKAAASAAGLDKQKEFAQQFQTLAMDRLKLLAQMSPEQRVSCVQQEMLTTMQMDPTARQQMMLDQMKARQSMDPQTRDAYRQMMRDTFQSMRTQGLIPEGEGGGRGDRGNRGRNRQNGQNGQGGQ